MNKRCFCLFLLLYACACTPDEDFRIVPGNPDLELTPDASSSIVINEDVFSILNLNYPGLETVNMLLEAEDTTNAVKALQQYYRTRPVLNPNVNMLSTAVTAEQTNIANQAILSGGFRFKVADYLDQYVSYLGILLQHITHCASIPHMSVMLSDKSITHDDICRVSTLDSSHTPSAGSPCTS